MKLAKTELDVGINASDPDATRAFYRDVMQFRELPSAPFGKGAMQHRFVVGRHLVKVNQYPTLPERERGGVERAIGMRMLAFFVDDLPSLISRLDSAGRKHSRLAGLEGSPL